MASRTSYDKASMFQTLQWLLQIPPRRMPYFCNMLCPSVLLVTVGFAALAHGLATDTLWPLPASIQWTDDRTLIFDKYCPLSRSCF